MTNNSFLSEPDAATFSGVSTQTLSRFAEAGYLTVETSSQGERLYSRDDITSVFGISEGSLARKMQEPQTETTSAASKSQSVIQFPSKKPDETPIAASAETKEDTDQLESEGEMQDESDSKVLGHDADVAVAAKTNGALYDDAERVRLQNIIDIQEKILDMRDDELKDLKKERDWLRERIERLEQKAERDQLLLLAETQTLRQLITHEKRSPVRATLEWLGFVQPATDPVVRSNSIDHGKK